MYGRISGVPVGARFSSRSAIYTAGVHRDVARRICAPGARESGAESVLLSGDCDDDVDLGTTIYFTGAGASGHRSAQHNDQDFIGLNLALADNVESGVPVRVVSFQGHDFEYRGLFRVAAAWTTQGSDGRTICKFELDQPSGDVPDEVQATPDRRSTTRFALVRDATVPARVKKMYNYTCQICGERIETIAGPYAEGAHIMPLGGPYGGGSDDISNVLCLCPNHHVMLDYGAIAFSDSWAIVDRQGTTMGLLRQHAEHGLDIANARAHRLAMGFDQ